MLQGHCSHSVVYNKLTLERFMLKKQAENNKLEVLSWAEVRIRVKKVNPDLFEAVEKVSPSSEYKVILARYAFGDSVLKDGRLQLPNRSGELRTIGDDSIDKRANDALAYTPNMPIGVILSKSLELYHADKNNYASWGIMTPGRIFSLWGLLQKPGTTSLVGEQWQIAAGARSVFSVPKISDVRGIQNLRKEFGPGINKPESSFEHWELFKYIARALPVENGWRAECLFFPSAWFEKLRSLAWQPLLLFLYQTAWVGTAYMRDQEVFELLLSRVLEKGNRKPSPYILDTFRHLYYIARSARPGLKVAEDDLVLPANFLQHALKDIYGISYHPTLVHPLQLQQATSQQPLYYSLNIPIQLIFSPHSKRNPNKLRDLKELAEVERMFSRAGLVQGKEIGVNPLSTVAQNVHFKYFHTVADKLYSIESASNLAQYDKALLLNMSFLSERMEFCSDSAFWRGCISITRTL